MNKTLTINLSGLVFHIDENAYDILRNYLERLKRRFSGNSGDEIITDIEGRIAEMFQEKISPAKNVITLEDVNSVISVMGNPEDIAGDESTPAGQQSTASSSSFSQEYVRRRLYRNPDNKILAGVCGGIGAYFDIDPIWLRLAFVLSLFLFGGGVFLYIVLWIIIPMAKTASEKLEMRGEPVNISNLEKNIKAEMESVKEQMNKLGNELNNHETRTRIKNFAENAGGFIRDVIKYVFKFLAVVIGLILTVFSLIALILLSIALFSVIGWIPTPANGISYAYVHYIIAPQSLWLLVTGVMLLIAIPFFVLFLNGIKLLFRTRMDLKKFGAIMLALWLVGVGLCVWQGVTVGREFHTKATVSNTEILPAFKNRTIHLIGNRISEGRNEWRDNEDRIYINGGVLSFTARPDSVMCNNIRLTVEQSRCDSVYFIRSFSSRGFSGVEARGLAQKMNYNYSSSDSSIVLNNAFNILHEERYRAQEMRLTLKVPVGYKIIFDKSMKDIQNETDNVSDVPGEEMSGHTWLMTKDGLQCKDCPEKNGKKVNNQPRITNDDNT